ncbi:MAG: hypothetical protein NTW03_21150, partial [Verrucomicrobia bacterium]|nr:hypothetical protein [Verrucomicrobiota bacterium]
TVPCGMISATKVLSGSTKTGRACLGVQSLISIVPATALPTAKDQAAQIALSRRNGECLLKLRSSQQLAHTKSLYSCFAVPGKLFLRHVHFERACAQARG